uniref:RAB11 family interacting protein 1 n=1 Tax=Poecilia reticulata TaxID=8081 RepID=A0A3P9P404_POERE
MSLADQQWSPTSVQVTVLQARGLRIKGKSGTNDAYAVMQVGKDKYQTSVVEKSVAPVWKEEASFDLPPLLLQAGGGGGKDRGTLHVQVLHRALVGPDKLLGQAVINLLQLSEDKTRNKTECQSSAESGVASTSEKDPTNIQREKRAAPKPPGRNQQERQKQDEEETSTQHLPQINKQSKDKDVKTVSVAPQRSVQMIAPLNRSSKDLRNTQSTTEHDSAKEATSKHNKRPAPSIPCAAEDELHRGAAEIKNDAVCGLNPFEDDDNEEENELTVHKDATTFVKSDPVVWPPVKSQAADKDSAKVKSSKVARAPLPPDPNDTPSSSTVSRNHDETDVSDDSGETAPNKACNAQQEVKSHVQVQESPNKESKKVVTTTGAREEGPPVISRRLQPVKPLNPLEQQSDSVGKVGNDKATGLDCNGVQHKTNVGTGRSGPYSQLTREELIALLLKQESQLSERDKKISELELYIDNLLVRVIEESPSILMSMSSLKKPV